MFKTEFEWLTSNTHVAYPFVEPVDPLNPGEENFSSLVVDSYILHDDDNRKSVKLSYLDDPAGASPQVIYRFEDDTVAFDSSGGSVKKSTFGNWLTIEWTTDTGVARLLFDNTKIGNYAWPAEPVNAFLVTFTTQPKPNNLLSVIAGIFQFEGTIELLEGFKVDINQIDNPAFTNTQPNRGRDFLRIDTGPGLGEGVFLDCEKPDPPILTINGVGPSQSGNFILDAADCYRLEQPVDEVAQGGMPGPPWYMKANTLQLFNDCEPCCDCDDYVYVYDELLRDLYARAKAASNRVYRARDAFTELVARMKQEKACREVPTVEVRVSARHGWTATIQAIIRNNNECPMEYVYLDFEVSGVTRPEYVKGSGFLNSKTLRQERFDPSVNDPCSSIIPEKRMSSYAPGSSLPYIYDECAAYTSFYVSLEEPILGTDALSITFQVYFKSYGTRKPDHTFDVHVTGFAGTDTVNTTARTEIPGPYNKE